MRVILAGTRSFGVAALDAVLDAGHEVPLVVTPADDKLALRAYYDHSLPVSHEMDHRSIEVANADLIVGAHTHAYIGQKSRAATKYGALIGHPSLLPRHRGKSSVEWTIKMRDPITGWTWFWADRGVDTGPIAIQDWCHVDPDYSASDLWREDLFPMGIRLLGDVLKELANGHQPWVPQDNRFATFEPSMEPQPLHRPELTPLTTGRHGA